MAENVPILVSYSLNEKELKKKMKVPPNIALADLIQEVKAEFECSQQIQLRQKEGDSSVLLKDPLNLNGKPRLIAEEVGQKALKEVSPEVPKKKVSPEASNVKLEPRNTLWIQRDGTIKKEILVYFYEDPPQNLRFLNEQVTNQLVMSLVNSRWDCDDVVDRDNRHIGGHVPRFKLVAQKKDADVRVKYGTGGSRSELGSNASKMIEETMVLDIGSASEARIKFNILHEFGHVLSLYHEQQHPDYLDVMHKFIDLEKEKQKFKDDNRDLNFTDEDFVQQNGRLPDGTFTMEYDPNSIMHYPTYLDALSDEFKEKIKDYASVDKMKQRGEISELEHRVLTGFIQCLDRNAYKPSEMDKIKVAQAYYNEWRKKNPDSNEKLSQPHPVQKPSPSGKCQIRSTYQGISHPEIQHLSFMKLGGERFKLLPQISGNYQDIAAVLQLEQHKRDVIETFDLGNRITEVLKHWTQNTAGGYPVTWQGLYDILDDSELTVIANQFFNFLERHENH